MDTCRGLDTRLEEVTSHDVDSHQVLGHGQMHEADAGKDEDSEPVALPDVGSKGGHHNPAVARYRALEDMDTGTPVTYRVLKVGSHSRDTSQDSLILSEAARMSGRHSQDEDEADKHESTPEEAVAAAVTVAMVVEVPHTLDLDPSQVDRHDSHAMATAKGAVDHDYPNVPLIGMEGGDHRGARK